MDTEEIKTIVALLLRHALTVYGGAAMFGQGDVQAISGAVAVLVGVGWSVYQKKVQKNGA